MAAATQSPIDYPAPGLWVPGFARKIRRGDQIRVTIMPLSADQSFNLKMRIMLPDGRETPLQTIITAGATNTLYQVNIPLVDGWLLNVSMNCVGTMLPGQSSVVIGHVGGTSSSELVATQLCIGLISTYLPLSWPDRPFSMELNTLGYPLAYAVATPAAGANWTQTLKADTQCKVMNVQATLTTDATVASRTAYLVFTSNSIEVLRVVPVITQAASLAIKYNWALGVTNSSQTGVSVLTQIPDIRLLETAIISIDTTNVQLTDQWSAITASALHWLG